MSALERLTAYLCSQVGSDRMDGYHEGYAKTILDQHAEELAEKLVAEAAVKAPIHVYRPGLMWAAEVIDPQADRE